MAGRKTTKKSGNGENSKPKRKKSTSSKSVASKSTTLIITEKPQAAGLAINVCGGETVSILDLVETLSGILSDVPAPEFTSPRAGDIYLSQGDPSRAEQILGFRAQVSLAEGLTETIEWMQT